MGLLLDFINFNENNTLTLNAFPDIKEYVLKQTEGRNLTNKQNTELTRKILKEIEKKIKTGELFTEKQNGKICNHI